MATPPQPDVSKLTYRERRLMRYRGMPARDVARVERMTIIEVLEIRAQLRARGVIPSVSELHQGDDRTPTQLDLQFDVPER